MKTKIAYLPISLVQDFIKDVFIQLGVSKNDAELCAEVLIASDRRGIESHGIGRLRYYYARIKAGQHKVQTNFEITRESPTTAVVDGHHGIGMVIAKCSMQIAIDKARQYGMGAVAVRNSTHFGIAGYYALMAVQQGMIGLTVTNARPSVSPTFSVQPMLDTNPIAFGAPSDEEFPFLYDAATPIIQRGKVEVYSRLGKLMRNGWVVDQHNEYMKNPDEVLGALNEGTSALLPLGGKGEELGGHKGYGLGTIVEVLSASLQQGAFLYGLTGISDDGEFRPFRLGHFFMAINIENFCSLEEFKATTGKIMRDLRNARKAHGATRIYTAGEKEFEMEKVTAKNGIPIVPTLQKDLLFLKQELGLVKYNFPF